MLLRCLSCQKSEPGKDVVQVYHKRCSRKLFGTEQPPNVPFISTEVVTEAQKMVGRMSISGAQPKLSITHDRRKHLLSVVARGGLLILKPPTERFDSLPENENLCMNLASIYGVEVPPHGLLPLKDGRPAYVVKRFDRLDDGTKLQQEDFQQLLQTEDKYAGSYERIGNFLKRHSTTPGLDLVNLFERALLFFVVGNGDAHLKNYSLLKKPGVGYSLSPAYDIVNSRLVLPEEKEEMCVSLQGKRNNISRKDFEALAEHLGLTVKQAQNAMERLRGLRSSMERMIQESYLEEPLRVRFLEIFRGRMERVFG